MSTHATPATGDKLVAISMSFDRDNLLARGFGLEHLKELLVRLARPLLREGVSLAYGGHWQEAEGNFTFDLLRLVSAEKALENERRTTCLAPACSPRIGRLINHSAWPHYLQITPAIEAEWINACRVVRVTPAMAGLAKLPPPGGSASARFRHERQTLLYQAACLSAMRKLVQGGHALSIPDVPSPELIQAVAARIVLGGQLAGYSGFAPGLFEEVLYSLEAGGAVFLLGGFGGAAEVLAKALLAAPGSALPEELTEAWQGQHTPALGKLAEACKIFPLPPGVQDTTAMLVAVQTAVERARKNLPAALNCGLDDADTRRLLLTQDMREASTLVRKGLLQLGLLTATP